MYVILVSYKGIFLSLGVSATVVLIIAMTLIGLILSLMCMLKRRRRLHAQPQRDLTSSSIYYSHINNYIQQRYNNNNIIIIIVLNIIML